ncbi:GNAT family N-acetyltransferase [Methanofollis aquaemaris]|uniref:GNAT family N-acetyltransferase n=1 Tax=Methanofollis aquaemaris TaxID=126734 RepID=A0A8A3S372_9EURY|nr:GNAT family N-acetyltransferase [Methanofollis aquaemaris]QSZ66363.1 GNAT family N-acetyltransferase [Methanofollis aquaemaris]
MSQYRLDRILHEEEISQLENLLVPILTNEYPNFSKWLEKVQIEITNGSRFANGIWKEKLIATSIIKLTASGIAELKSFFIDPNFQHSGYGNDLYDDTETQCRKAGVKRIISYIYTDDTPMIEFLISKGFLISGKEDLYGNSRESYILSKALDPEYFGDPFDWEGLGEWYLQTRLNAINIKDHPLVNDRRFDRHMMISLGDYSIHALVEVKDQKVDLDPVSILHKHCNESEYHLPIFIAREFTERAENYAKKNAVIIFNSRDIAQYLGRKTPVICEGTPKGMIVSIKPDYLERLLRQDPPYYYIKGGPSGKSLKAGQTLVFYSTAPEKCVKALGKIRSVTVGTPDEIWNMYNQNLVLSKEEYFRFASIKQKILVIELNDVSEITSIKEDELDTIISKKDRSGSYIDEKTLNGIIKLGSGFDE